MYRNNFENYEGKYKLEKDWVFPFSQVGYGSQIVLYGAGDVGQAYHKQIEDSKYCHVIAWVDRCYQQWNTWGIDVCDPVQITQISFDFVVIAVSEMGKAKEIHAFLISIGVPREKIIWIGDRRTAKKGSCYENRLLKPVEHCVKQYLTRRGIDPESEFGSRIVSNSLSEVLDENKLVVPRMVFELTRMCSLKCRHCNNLMNRYDHPKHVELDVVLRDIRALSEAADKIITIELIGGEPFVYPYLKDVINYVVDIDNIWGIEITTNGTVIPKNEVLDVLKNPKVTVRISRYEVSSRIDELEETLFLNGVRFEEISELSWIDSGDINSRGRSLEQLLDIYNRCPSSYYCKTVLEGKVFSCARAASMYDLGIVEDEESYVTVEGNQCLKRDLKEFFLKLSDVNCDRCDVTDIWRVIAAGEQ